MKFIECLGYENADSSYIKFNINNGVSYYCDGDLVWCDQHTLLISDYITPTELECWAEENEIRRSTVRAIQGVLRRMEVF